MTNTAVILPVKLLKEILNIMLDHIILDLQTTEVEVTEDFYWTMAKEDLYCLKDKPPELTIGSLRDDWDFLSKMSKDRQEAVALMFIHVAPLLRYLGEKIGR